VLVFWETVIPFTILEGIGVDGYRAATAFATRDSGNFFRDAVMVATAAIASFSRVSDREDIGKDRLKGSSMPVGVMMGVPENKRYLSSTSIAFHDRARPRTDIESRNTKRTNDTLLISPVRLVGTEGRKLHSLRPKRDARGIFVSLITS
jgi:hypothetical protein